MKKSIQFPLVIKPAKLFEHSKLFRAFGVMAISLLVVATVQAATITWDGSSNTNWATAANWSSNSVPTASDDVIIPSGVPNFPTISAPVTVKSVDVKENAKLTLVTNGTLNVSGATSVGIYVRGELKNNGKIYINNTGGSGMHVSGSDGNAQALLYGDTYIGNSGSIGGDGVFVEDLLILDTDPVFFYDLTPTLQIDNVSGNGLSCFFGTVNIRETGSGLFTPNTQVKIGTSGTVGNIGIASNGDINFTAGTITIEDSGMGKNGLSNVTGGDFSMGSGAELRIGSATAQISNTGVYNQGQFSSNGLINIVNTGNHGMEVTSSGTFSMVGTAQLDIGSATAQIGSLGILNQGQFSSNGLININNTAYDGIRISAGSFSNTGMVTLGSTTAIGIDGIYVTLSGSFLNEGLIQIESCSGLGINANSGGSFTNNSNGEIRIGQAGIGSTIVGILASDNGSFSNGGGLIKIDLSSVSGIQVQNNGVFENNSQGLILLGASSTFQFSINAFGSTLTNAACAGIIQYGSNKIDAPALTNNGWIIDHSSLTNTIGTNNGIVQNLNGGNFNITTNNGTVVTNEGIIWTGCSNDNWMTAANWAGGAVPVTTDDVIIPPASNFPAIGGGQSASIRSLKILGGGQLNCFGNLTLNGSAGVGIDNEGTLLNFNTIKVDNTGLSGIYNHATGTFSTFLSSSLLIGNNGGNIGNHGIDNDGGASFTCSGGLVLIDNCNSNGIENDNSLFTASNNASVRVGTTIGNIGGYGIYNYQTNATFTIDGSTVLVNNTANWGIFNDADFINKNNGKLDIGPDLAYDAWVSANDGTLTNADCSTVNIFKNFDNGGIVTNEGYFYFNTPATHFNNGTFTNNGVMNFAQLPVMPNIINNGVIASPFSLTCNVNNNALQLGGSNSFTLLNEWFLDQDLTDKAGDYDQSSNTFIATNIPAGTQALYFNATNGSCTFDLSVAVTAPATVGDGDRTWAGTVDTDWGNPCNWSPIGLPAASENVTIPDVANDPVIGSMTAATAKSVAVDANALLTIENDGSLTIDGAGGTGLEVSGTVSNGGTLQVDNTGSNAIMVASGGVFTNTASIELGQNGGSGNITGAGIWNVGTFNNNNGQINIDHTGSHAVTNTATFNNSSTLYIGQNGGSGSISAIGIRVTTSGAFHHLAGEIRIDHASTGVGVLQASFYNHASIKIGETSGVNGKGISVDIGGFYENKPGSYLSIDNTGADAVSMSFGFTNSGELEIGQNGAVGGDGFKINLLNGQFLNNASGMISIDNVASHGMECISGVAQNYGQITIGGANGIGLKSIKNSVSFVNQTCGRLTLLAPLQNTGSFNNLGLLTINTAGTNALGSLANNGIVEDVQGTFSGGTNNEIIVAPVSTTDCTTVSPAFGLGSPVDFNILGIFTDAAATQSAGTYDVGTNTFTPTAPLSQAPTIFYVKIEDPTGGCTRIVEWTVDATGCCSAPFITCYLDSDGDNYGDIANSQEFCQVCGTGYVLDNTDCNDNDANVNPSPDCSTTTRTWTGHISTDWDEPCNWSPNCVPTANEDVIIAIVPTYPVIESSTSGFAKSVLMYTGTQLTTLSGSSLSISGSDAEGLGIQPYGDLFNGGTINIDNTASDGLLTESQADITNTGTIAIGLNGGNIGGDGLHQGGAINNSGTIAIAGASAMAFWGGSTLTNTGILKGVGIFDMNGNPLGGTFAPGNSPGQATFSDDQSFPSGSILEIEVNGTTPETQHDVVEVAGMATLGGTLSVIINYAAATNDRIVFLTATTVSGTFSNFNPALPADWSLDYSVSGEVALVFSGVLPVELVSFTAKRNERIIGLEWQTASESNNEGFEVEHSMDGKNWNFLGFVAGHGTSQDAHHYFFLHETPSYGTNYYRLRQVDFDGNFEYSDIRSVLFEDGTGEVKVFPNPAAGYTSLLLPNDFEQTSIRLFDPTGRLLLEREIPPEKSPYLIDLNSLRTGAYFLQIETGGRIYSQKLWVQMD